jgi:hypothetical protein
VKKQTLVSAVAAVATAAVLGMGGAALAQAGQSVPTSVPTSVQADASPSATATPGAPAGQGRERAPGLTKEKLKDWIAKHGLTGDTAVKVTEAAVAKEPTAYVLRVGKLADGTYVARMMRPDGTRIVLMIDANFAVTSVEDAPEKVPGQGRGAGKGAKNNASTASPTASS